MKNICFLLFFLVPSIASPNPQDIGLDFPCYIGGCFPGYCYPNGCIGCSTYYQPVKFHNKTDPNTGWDFCIEG